MSFQLYHFQVMVALLPNSIQNNLNNRCNFIKYLTEQRYDHNKSSLNVGFTFLEHAAKEREMGHSFP